MKKVTLLLIFIPLVGFCQFKTDKEKIKLQVFEIEKAFEKMCVDSSIELAFYFFAAENAVIKRGNDSLIFGKAGIKNYYSNTVYKRASVQWTPDVIEVSDDGTMASTFGKYIWKIKKENGEIAEFKGIFHTVWKKQKDNSWKYIWD